MGCVMTKVVRAHEPASGQDCYAVCGEKADILMFGQPWCKKCFEYFNGRESARYYYRRRRELSQRRRDAGLNHIHESDHV